MAQSIESRVPAERALAAQTLNAVQSFQRWLDGTLPSREWYGLALLLGACWLALRPYLFTHDGRLYALQAMAALSPELATDPALSHFNQSKLSLFTPLYSLLVAQIGLWPAAWLLYTVTQLLYYAALMALVSWLLPNRRLGLLALAALVSGAGTYPPGLFGYAESFVSARLIASALTLIALVAARHQRWLGATLLLLTATAMHPLMAIAGWVLLGWWLGREWFSLRVMVILASAGLALAVVVALQLPTMSPQWLAIVTARSEYLFITRWPASQWAVILSSAVIIGLSLNSELPRLRRLSEALLLVLISAVLLALVAAWHPNSWLLALQPWRSLWLVAIGSILLALHCLTRPAQQPADLAAQAALLTGLTLGTAHTPFLLALIPLARYGRRETPAHNIWQYTALALLALALLMVLLSPLVGFGIAQRVLATATADFHYLELIPKLRPFFLMPLILAGVIVLMHRPSRPLPLAALAGGLLLLAGLLYDRAGLHQDPRDEAALRQLKQRIAPTEQVYWPERVSRVWFDLQRPSYASRWQGAPGIFSEALAVDINARLLHMVRAGLEPAHNSILGAERITPAVPADLHLACADSRLSWLILPDTRRLPRPATAWSFRFQGEPLLLIDCRPLRGSGGAGGGS